MLFCENIKVTHFINFFKTKPGERLFPALLFLLALLVRSIYVWQYSSAPDFDNPSGDAGFFYDEACKLLQNGSIFGDTVPFQSPVYPLFMALVFKLTGSSFLILRLVQVVIGSLNCLVVYFLVKKASPSTIRPAIIAGIFTALYGTLVFFDGDLLMISLTLFFIDASILGLILFRERQHLIWPGLAGLSFGIAILDRSNLLLFLPVAIWFLFRGIRRRPLLPVIMYLSGVIVIILPFTINNYRVSRDMVLISSNAGINLFIGNNPQAPGIFAIPPGTAIRNNNYAMAEDAAAIAETELQKKLKPSEVSRFWAGKALEFVVENPFEATRLYVKKFRLLFNRMEVPNHLSFNFYRKEVTPCLSWLFIGFWIIAPLALMGIFAGRYAGFSPDRKLFLAFIVVYSVSLLPFFIADRYRLPLIPFLIIFAALGLENLRTIIMKQEWEKIIFPGIILIAAYMFVNKTMLSGFDNYSRSTFAEKYVQRASEQKQTANEDLTMAILHYKHAIEATVDYPIPYVQLSEVYERIGCVSGAVRLLKDFKAKGVIPEERKPLVEQEIIRLQHIYEQAGDRIFEYDIPQTFFEQAVAQEDSGHVAAAEEIYKWIIRHDIEHTGAWIRLSKLHTKRGNMAAAATCLEEAWKVNPMNVYILQELLNNYKVAGNWRKYEKTGRVLAGKRGLM